jgi:superfamily II DNA or RNA helicase
MHGSIICSKAGVVFNKKESNFQSIQWDYDNFGFDFDLTIINDESLHLVSGEFDLIIHDEHHRFGAFPKPNATAKEFKKRFSKLPMIFLSGTPTPEIVTRSGFISFG